MQYHAFDKIFIKSYVKKCSEKSLLALKKLNLKSLKEIFALSNGLDTFTEAYLQKILDRRDQLLKSQVSAE